jgi:hypothetical protein
LSGGYYGGPTQAVTSAIQLMPFVSRPRSLAVGAMSGVHGQIQGAELNLKSQFGFGNATWDHSGQWNRNIQDPAVSPFYFQLRFTLFPP